MATNYKEAFAQIRSNPELAHKFVNDPKATLSGLGIDTSKLATAPNSAADPNLKGVCVGCGICAG